MSSFLFQADALHARDMMAALDALFMAHAGAFQEYQNLRGDYWALAGARSPEEAVKNQEQWARERETLMALNFGGNE